MVNPVGWFEIYVNDMTRAMAFYRRVFAARFSAIEGTSSASPAPVIQAFAMDANRYGAAGALVQMAGFRAGNNSVIVYFSCEDCAFEAAAAIAAGGRLQKPKTAIVAHGFMALVQDSEGNLIGLHSRR